jgi:hypothetical protein
VSIEDKAMKLSKEKVNNLLQEIDLLKKRLKSQELEQCSLLCAVKNSYDAELEDLKKRQVREIRANEELNSKLDRIRNNKLVRDLYTFSGMTDSLVEIHIKASQTYKHMLKDCQDRFKHEETFNSYYRMILYSIFIICFVLGTLKGFATFAKNFEVQNLEKKLVRYAKLDEELQTLQQLVLTASHNASRIEGVAFRCSSTLAETKSLIEEVNLKLFQVKEKIIITERNEKETRYISSYCWALVTLCSYKTSNYENLTKDINDISVKLKLIRYLLSLENKRKR